MRSALSPAPTARPFATTATTSSPTASSSACSSRSESELGTSYNGHGRPTHRALTVTFLDNYTLQTVALGTAALGAVAGGLGGFAVLRRQSLLADAVSHAALPGVVL